MAQQLLDQDVEMRHGLPCQGDICKNYSAIRKVIQVFGWSIEVELHDGIT